MAIQIKSTVERYLALPISDTPSNQPYQTHDYAPEESAIRTQSVSRQDELRLPQAPRSNLLKNKRLDMIKWYLSAQFDPTNQADAQIFA